MQVIYIDMLFLLNFIMDLMIFWISGSILGCKMTIKRIVIGSGMAALVYCLFVVLPVFYRWPTFVLQLFVPIGSILYLYRPQQLKVFIKDYVVCTLTACIIGGVAFNLYYSLLKMKQMTPWIPIGAGLILCMLLFVGLRWIKKRLVSPHFEYEVNLEQGDKKATLAGYLDTGNTLYTVGKAQPVMVASYKAILPILSERQIVFLKDCKEKGFERTIEGLDKSLHEKYYLIPFNSIGCKEGMLIGIPVQKVRLKRGTWDREFEEGIVAVHFEQLFNGDVYDILIHPDYMKIE